MTATMDDLRAPIAALEPIGLDELMELAALQTRVDRKYLLPLGDLERLLEHLSPDARALEIEGTRSFGYESVYFDTPELTSYHLSARRRRRRFKVRTRTYLDSGQCWLEVKTRDNRGRTVKQRLAYALDDRATLTPAGRGFADLVLVEAAVAARAMTFAPTLVTRYHRSTLFLPTTASRVTIDTRLGWDLDDSRHVQMPDLVVVETKTGSTASSFDRLLWSRGHRPTSISKYATGLAALRPDLPSTRWHRVLRHHFYEPVGPTASMTMPDHWSL